MGTSRWDSSTWSSYSTVTSTKSVKENFTQRGMDPDLNPLGVVVRESRDSDINPESNAIIIGVDVTGSMGMIANYFVKTGLGILFENIYDRKPVKDPHVMFMAIGDAYCDSCPLQVSQFEADITIAKQLEKVYVEQGGGGNSHESYELPWYFAAYHTSIDCYEKRGKRGYLITIGDEETPPKVKAEHISKFIGDTPEVDMSLEEMYEAVSKMYNVYHIMIAEGSYCRYNNSAAERVKQKWTNLLGQNAIWLTDYNKLSEVIVSIIEVNEGKDTDTVISSWSGDTSLVVKSAISNITRRTDSNNTGITRL